MPPETITYLSAADIERIGIDPSALRRHIGGVFQAHARGQTLARPKQTLQIKPGHFFQAMCAATHEPPHVGLKWVGINGQNPANGLPAVTGLIILSDLNSGLPVAIMDARLLTVLRTAALSALAAERLARPDSRSIGFVGCGEQALGHLTALRAVLPNLAETVWYSPDPASAEKAAQTARDCGLKAHVANGTDPVLACDIVVTTVPNAPGLEPFLDARKLLEGAFVIAVDLARSWLPDQFSAIGRVFTDDLAQTLDPENRKKLTYGGEFEADLSQLMSGVAQGRNAPDERLMFLFPGIPLADVAAAQFVLAEAERKIIGTALPR